nr:MAG: major capsid protein [Microvirus sp.]
MRFMPMIASPLHEVWAYFDFFSVPYRITDPTFEDFITGGEDGLDATSPPRWNPSAAGKVAVGTLWDYLGFPSVEPSLNPVAWPQYAYNMIYNKHYRVTALQAEVPLTNEDLLLGNWELDYFTGNLPWQQRGVAPALPVTGASVALWDAAEVVNGAPASPINATFEGTGVNTSMYVNNAQARSNAWEYMNDNTVDLSLATTFDIADLREAIQIQRFLELNARAGSRLNEFLRGQFNIAPIDKTLQEPEFIGRCKLPVMMDEVAQTSAPAVGAPLGQVAGKGIAVGNENVGSVRIEEPGLVMGIMCVKPKPAYQQGINRAWLIQSKYDYPFPVFANLSEQETMVGEIYADGVADDATFGGFTGRYDEYRIMQDSVHGLLKQTVAGYSHWHMGRIFAAQPALNGSFLQCDCSAIKARIMAVPAEPTFIANVGNIVSVTRALPLYANPSLMEKI